MGSRSLTDTGRLRRFAGCNRLRQRWIGPEDDRRARPPRLAGPNLDELEGSGVHDAPPLMDARLWAGEPQPTGGRQSGRTSDVVFFPPRGG